MHHWWLSWPKLYILLKVGKQQSFPSDSGSIQIPLSLRRSLFLTVYGYRQGSLGVQACLLSPHMWLPQEKQLSLWVPSWSLLWLRIVSRKNPSPHLSFKSENDMTITVLLGKMYVVNSWLHFLLFLKGRLYGTVGCTQSLDSEGLRFISSIRHILLVPLLANCFSFLHLNFLLSELTGLLCQHVLVLRGNLSFPLNSTLKA